MKFTVVLIGLFSISSSWAEKQSEEQKDKREAPLGYPSSGHSTQTLQIQPSHDDSNTISIGAGYSVGGARGALSFGGHPQQSGLHYEGLQSNGGHATIQLPPITLQPNQGAGDISELMSQLSHGLSTGALQLQPVGGSHYPAAAFGQEASHYSFGAPKHQQYSASESQQHTSVPSYAAGTKGLGSYGGASTGPVLFNPADSQSAQYAQSALYSHSSQYAQPTQYAQSAQYIQPSQYAHSFGNANAGSGHSFGNAALSLGNSGHSFGGGSFKSLGGNYGSLGKTSFKPSAFLGSTVQNEGPHAISGISTHAVPSFGHSYAGGHAPVSLVSGGHGSFGGNLGGFGGGSSKLIAPSYLPHKTFGSGLDALASFSNTNSHSSSPPGTTYGFPAATHGFSAGSPHGASSSPQLYLSSSKHRAPSFGEGSSFKAPVSSHGSLSSFSSGPKYNFGGQSSSFGSSRYASPKDSHGAYSESTYNTIKYSEELKPRVH